MKILTFENLRASSLQKIPKNRLTEAYGTYCMSRQPQESPEELLQLWCTGTYRASLLISCAALLCVDASGRFTILSGPRQSQSGGKFVVVAHSDNAVEHTNIVSIPNNKILHTVVCKLSDASKSYCDSVGIKTFTENNELRANLPAMLPLPFGHGLDEDLQYLRPDLFSRKLLAIHPFYLVWKNCFVWLNDHNEGKSLRESTDLEKPTRRIYIAHDLHKKGSPLWNQLFPELERIRNENLEKFLHNNQEFYSSAAKESQVEAVAESSGQAARESTQQEVLKAPSAPAAVNNGRVSAGFHTSIRAKRMALAKRAVTTKPVAAIAATPAVTTKPAVQERKAASKEIDKSKKVTVVETAKHQTENDPEKPRTMLQVVKLRDTALEDSSKKAGTAATLKEGRRTENASQQTEESKAPGIAQPSEAAQAAPRHVAQKRPAEVALDAGENKKKLKSFGVVEDKILKSLAQYLTNMRAQVAPVPLVAFLSGYANIQSSAFNKALRNLVEEGVVANLKGDISATDTGNQYLPSTQPLMTNAEVQEWLLGAIISTGKRRSAWPSKLGEVLKAAMKIISNGKPHEIKPLAQKLGYTNVGSDVFKKLKICLVEELQFVDATKKTWTLKKFLFPLKDPTHSQNDDSQTDDSEADPRCDDTASDTQNYDVVDSLFSRDEAIEAMLGKIECV